MKYSESLKKNVDFQKVYKNGTSHANRYLVMYVLKNEKKMNRLGISVSKKVGNSIVRHRITRLIREVYRLNEEHFSRGFDIVVIARKSLRNCGYETVEKSFLQLGGHHCLIVKEKENEISVY